MHCEGFRINTSSNSLNPVPVWCALALASNVPLAFCYLLPDQGP